MNISSISIAISVFACITLISPKTYCQDKAGQLARVIRESQNIVVGKVTSSVAQWRNDEYGRHIYTTYALEVTHNIRGTHLSIFSVEVMGGTVDDLNEFVSSELYLAEQETYILFFNEFPVRFRDPDHSVMQVFRDYCNVLGRDVSLHSFLDVLREIDQRPDTRDTELIQMLQNLTSASRHQGMDNPPLHRGVIPGQSQTQKVAGQRDESLKLNEDCSDGFLPESTVGNIVKHHFQIGSAHDHDDDGYLSF